MAKSNRNRNTNYRGGKDKDFRDKPNESKGSRTGYRERGDRTDNDASWYGKNPEMLRAAASLPYAWPLGNEIRLENNGVDTAVNAAIPGIGVLHWIPSIGISENKISPVNIAANMVYTWTRHVNSGSANYDAPDQMMYILAMDSLYSYYAAVRRAYGLLNLYSKTNKYFPRAVLTALGFDFDDLIENAANLNYWLNNYAYKLSSLAVPGGMSYFARHVWMNDNIYMDQPDTAKAQMYAFKQEAYFKFTNLGETGSELLGVPVPRNMKFQDIVDFGNELMDVCFTDEDFRIMSGDIVKAWGKDNLVQIYNVPTDYTVTPAFNGEVLSQIQNATLCGDPVYDADSDSDVGKYKVSQRVDVNEGAILFNPYFKTGKGQEKAIQLRHILTMSADEVTPEMNMVASRLTNICSGLYEYAENIHWAKFANLGSEVATRFSIWCYKRNPTTDEYSLNVEIQSKGVTLSIVPSMNEKVASFLSWASAFHAHPCFILCADDEEGTPLAPLFEISNYTVIDDSVLKRMHETALISEFDVPRVGKG